jgi:hypothetical protein
MTGSSEDQPPIQERKRDEKAAQQRGTPKRKRLTAPGKSATFWSAAVFCRF